MRLAAELTRVAEHRIFPDDCQQKVQITSPGNRPLGQLRAAPLNSSGAVRGRLGRADVWNVVVERLNGSRRLQDGRLCQTARRRKERDT